MCLYYKRVWISSLLLPGGVVASVWLSTGLIIFPGSWTVTAFLSQRGTTPYCSPTAHGDREAGCIIWGLTVDLEDINIPLFHLNIGDILLSLRQYISRMKMSVSSLGMHFAHDLGADSRQCGCRGWCLPLYPSIGGDIVQRVDSML